MEDSPAKVSVTTYFYGNVHGDRIIAGVGENSNTNQGVQLQFLKFVFIIKHRGTGTVGTLLLRI